MVTNRRSSKRSTATPTKRAEEDDLTEVGIDSKEGSPGAKGPVLPQLTPHVNAAWGRCSKPNFTTITTCASVMLFCPLLALLSYSALEHFDGSVLACFASAYEHIKAAWRLQPGSGLPDLQHFVRGLYHWASLYFPQPSLNAAKLYCGWVLFQALLYAFLPAKIGYGQQTPAGHILPYKVNGLLSWVVSHAIFIYGAWYAQWWSPSIIAKEWPGLLICANVYGYALTLFAYIKAHVAPSHVNDCKFSGSWIYDMYFGIEMNPRFGKMWDFKLFHNGRPGITAWTLINLSFTAWQYELHGYVTNSIIIVNILQAFYVVDFFYNEDWYLRTIVPFLCFCRFKWHDAVWLPAMYTLQAQYLARYPVQLSPLAFTLVLSIGLSGYWIFRAVNHQKDLVRRTDAKCTIWGRPAEVIRAQYVTSDGTLHRSILLCSGFWGITRHANYLGDLILSFCMCAACGVSNLLPYTYIIFMVALLLNRCSRDDARCTGKYGKYWEEYKRRVPYTLVPGIY